MSPLEGSSRRMFLGEDESRMPIEVSSTLYRLIPEGPSNKVWEIFYGDAHIPVKHEVFDRYLHQNTCFGYIFD